ncbi:YXWGXW repeat-containing protein [Agrobacterium tumefaciens]|uniref:YXWGXW repeat-containing protein n=1 Tax=Agrobacterium tumefaciens TaxID=358 RepID=UPI000DD066B2
MERHRRLFLQLIGALILVPGAASSETVGPRAPVGRRPPPPPKREEHTPPPRKGYRWIEGRWVWNIRRSRYVWVAGRFQRHRS